jgi:hypothetical protein
MNGLQNKLNNSTRMNGLQITAKNEGEGVPSQSVSKAWENPYNSSFAVITRCTASSGVFPTAERCPIFRPLRGFCFS